MELHTIDPVWDKDSRILILGSFPSVKSRETQFFYGHPQNRFWKVLAAITKEPVPQTIEQKKQLLHDHHIALWDVIASCDITGSSDASIKNVTCNDIPGLLAQTGIQAIYVNGQAAKKLYDKYLAKSVDIPAQVLPSTSPANASYSLDRLLEHWTVIEKDLTGQNKK